MPTVSMVQILKIVTPPFKVPIGPLGTSRTLRYFLNLGVPLGPVYCLGTFFVVQVVSLRSGLYLLVLYTIELIVSFLIWSV